MATNLDGKFDKVLNLYKRKSETPLQTIERYVSAHPEYKGVKMTYAGRLDPMAEGVLVVLTGEKNKEREAYTGLDKDYEFEFIFGVETDTHDVLGKITASKEFGKLTEKEIKDALKKYEGTFKQKYPAYSSKVVDGTPLFDLARKGKLGTIVMPEHEVEVRKIELLGSKEITRGDFAKQIQKDISAVTGDFRQAEILKVWNAYLSEKAPEAFVVYKAKVTSGSGFYVRQLVSDLGKALGTGAITTHILRTRVGSFTLRQ
jgi:tRNA pseudouridine55 synthase